MEGGYEGEVQDDLRMEGLWIPGCMGYTVSHVAAVLLYGGAGDKVV